MLGRLRSELGDTLIFGVLSLRTERNGTEGVPLGAQVRLLRKDPTAALELLPLGASARKEVTGGTVAFFLLVIAGLTTLMVLGARD